MIKSRTENYKLLTALIDGFPDSMLDIIFSGNDMHQVSGKQQFFPPDKEVSPKPYAECRLIPAQFGW